MRGVTIWVTNAAVWVTGKVGDLIDATASPDVQAGWFREQYATMLAVAGALALPMLLLAVIQAVMRQDIGDARCARRSATCRWRSSSPAPRSSRRSS